MNFFLTLNPASTPSRIWTDRSYAHPIFDTPALQAQARLQEIDGIDGVFFCGSYWGWGLHEDGFRSGVDAAQRVHASLKNKPSVVENRDGDNASASEIDAIIAAAKSQRQ